MTTATTTCPCCEGAGEVRNWSLSADQVDDHRTCPECHGDGEIPLRTPDAIARRESAAPHGCTGADCATCGDDTPALVRYTVARLLRTLRRGRPTANCAVARRVRRDSAPRGDLRQRPCAGL